MRRLLTLLASCATAAIMGLLACGEVAEEDDASGFIPGSADPAPPSEITLEASTVIVDAGCPLRGKEPALSAFWAKQFGDVIPLETIFAIDYEPNGLAIDGAGNIVVVGSLRGRADFGGGPISSTTLSDVFVAKYDALGKHLWSKRFGDDGTQSGALEYGLDVAVDGTGSIYLAGSFVDPYGTGSISFGGDTFHTAKANQRRGFLAKLDAQGNHVWSKAFGDNTFDTNAQRVLVNPNGDVVLAGTFAGDVDFGGGVLPASGESSIFAVKYGSDGKYLWGRTFAAVGSFENLWGGATDPSGNVVLTGSFRGTIDFTNDIDAGPGLVTDDAGNQNGFVVKLDRDGHYLWSREMGSTSDGIVIASRAAFDDRGDVVVAGFFDPSMRIDADASVASSGGTNRFLLKLAGTDGARRWLRVPTETDAPTSMALAAIPPNGDVLWASSFQTSIDLGGASLTSDAGTPQLFAVKLDGDGGIASAHAFAGGVAPAARALAIDRCGNEVAFAGAFRGGSLAFPTTDGGTVVLDASPDAFPSGGEAFVTRVATP